jgi:hypothetical protein
MFLMNCLSGRTSPSEAWQIEIYSAYGRYGSQYQATILSDDIYSGLLTLDLNYLKELIESILQPINFVNNQYTLNNVIKQFNQYLAFDNLLLSQNNGQVILQDYKKNSAPMQKQDLLNLQFGVLQLDGLQIDQDLTNIIKQRVSEIEKCIEVGASLSIVLLCGSILESILLNTAKQFPEKFNTYKNSPKDKNNQVRKFDDWTLNDFIDVSCGLGLINQNVKKFSHALREFRNYIHPSHQVKENFTPDIETSKISYQVLRLAISQLSVLNKEKVNINDF